MEELDGMARRDFSKGHALLNRNFYYDTVITYSCDMGNYLTNKTKIGKLFLHIKQEAFKNLVYETDNGYSWCALLNSRGNVLAESGEKDEEIQKILEERNKEGKRIQEGKTAGFFRILSRNRDWDWRCICQKTGSGMKREIFFSFLSCCLLPA